MHIDCPPFTILVLGDFSPTLETDNPPLIKTDPLSSAQALEEIRPSLDIPVDKTICPEGNLSVSISKMSDFKPKNISRNITFLKRITDAKKFIKTDNSESSFRSEFPDLAELITFPAVSASAKKPDSGVLDDLLSMVEVKESSSVSQSKEIKDQLERIHAALLEKIFADSRFRRLESAWRGLELLCRQSPSGSETNIQLFLVPISKDNLSAIVNRLQSEFAESGPDLILLDRPLSNSPRSMQELEEIMNFAETLLAPAMVQLSPQFFEIGNWSEVDALPFIPSLLEGAEYGRWKTLRESSAAGWLMPCTGNIMARTMHTREAGYETTSLTEKGPLWTGTVWGAGALCVRSLAQYGRPTLFADHSMIRIEGLPLAEGSTPAPLNPPLGTERIKDFRQAGITAPAFSGDQAFILHATSMDGGPFNLRLYLSRLIHFLILLSTEKRKEFNNLENDLSQAVKLFIQKQGYPSPDDLNIKAEQKSGDNTSLEISLTPGPEVLPGNAPITFGFNW